MRLISDFKPEECSAHWLRPVTSPPLLNWLMNRSRIALNFDYFPDIPVYAERMRNVVINYDANDVFSIRSRLFTAMGAGAAVMVERHPQVQRFFRDGEEVIMWESLEEAVERAGALLREPHELHALAFRGHAKAARLHSAPVRIEQMLAVMQGAAEELLHLPAAAAG